MDTKTILGQLKKEPLQKEDKTKEKQFEVQQQPNMEKQKLQTNISKLSKLLNLDNKKRELEDNEIVFKQFKIWQNSIKAKPVIIEQSNVNHFQYSIEKLKNHLQILNVQQNEDELNYEEMQSQEIQKDLLNQKFLQEYQYRQKQKSKICIQINSFFFDYFYQELNEDFQKSLIAQQDQEKDLEKNINFDIYNILQSSRDLYITDFENQNEQEYIRTILYYLIRNNVNLYKQQQAPDNQVSGYVNLKTIIIVHYKHEAFQLLQTLLDIQNFQNEQLLQKLEEQLFSEQTAFEDDFFVALRIKKDILQPSLKLDKADIIISTTKYLNKEKFQASSNLSSIQYLFIYKFDHYMQTNIEELKNLISNLNKVPNYNLVTSNFNNINKIFTENVSQFYRQNIIYSQFQSLELNSVSTKLSLNYRGLMRMKNFYTDLISDVQSKNQHFEFQNVCISNAKNEFQERFNFIQNKFWNEKRIDNTYDKSLIIVRNYFFYKKIKILLQKKHSPVGFISEHTPRNKIQSILVQFNQEKFKYILITERALFFDTCKPKRYNNLIFLQIPFLLQTFDYLKDNLEQNSSKNNVSFLYSKFDFYELEKIIGTTKAIDLVNNKNKFNLTTINQLNQKIIFNYSLSV